MEDGTSKTNARMGIASAVVGLQWGDEGKGKLVDLLASEHDAVVRYNGGANAGHSVVVGGTRYALHLVPSGILYPGKRAVIGNGVVVDPHKLVEELSGLAGKGVDTSGLVLSDRAHVVMPWHKVEDALREEMLAARDGSGHAIGTTKRGIGPAYAEKAQRAGAIRVGDLLDESVLRERVELALAIKKPLLERLAHGTPHEASLAAMTTDSILAALRPVVAIVRGCVHDTTWLLHDLLRDGGSVLFESANGSLLDIDHGTYPFVTSSTCVVSGIGAGTGVPAQRLGRVVGVMKAYTTRVGGGPMPTELLGEAHAGGDGAIAHRIRERGREYGTTTGRPRRVGWLDLVAVRYSVMVNGVTDIALTMLDVLSGMDEVRVCVGYRGADGRVEERFHPDAQSLARCVPVHKTLAGFGAEISGVTSREHLPREAREYVAFIESFLGVPASIVSVGPGREQTLGASELLARLRAARGARA